MALYKVTQSAAEVGVTPPIIYANADKGILVQQRINSQTAYFLDLPKDIQMEEILKLLQQMRDIQANRPVVNNIPYIKSLESELRCKWGCIPSHMEIAISELKEIPIAPDQLAYTHNDFHFNNLLWDGNRLWLIDFDDAGPGDPMFDFAWMIDYLQPNDEQREAWLRKFLGRDITDHDKTRLRMYRKTHLVRDALFLAQSTPTPEDCKLPKPLGGAFDELSRQNFQGPLDLSEDNSMLSAVSRLIEEALRLK